MEIKDLVGYRLVSGDEDGFVVEKDNKSYFLKILEKSGYCCDYNEIITHFDTREKPIITNIKFEECNEVFDNPTDTMRITFFGLNKEIGRIESNSTSGSGYNYGACVTIKCKKLNIEEVITEW